MSEALPELEYIKEDLDTIKRLLAIYILATARINPPHLEFAKAVAHGED